MIKPLNNHILCELVKEEKKTALILVEEEKRMEKGIVTAKADEIDIVDEGDQILFQSYSLNPVEVDGKEVFFIKADDILGIEK